MNIAILPVSAALSLVTAGHVFACGIEGMVNNPDGSKVDGTSAISTSWNSKKAFPERGSYSLELGPSV